MSDFDQSAFLDAMDSLTGAKERYASMRRLWKSDDTRWLAEREAEWDVLSKDLIHSGYKKDESVALKKFYLTGEEPKVGHKPHDRVRFLLTPTTNAEEARQLYELFSHPNDRQMVMRGFMDYACEVAHHLPWLRQRISDFLDGVHGRNYRYVGMEHGGRNYDISDSPSEFCCSYALSGYKYLKRDYEYWHNVDTLPYFMSALPLADDPDVRERIRIEKMMRFAHEVADNNEDTSILKVAFARELVGLEGEIYEKWNLHA